jgi:hypothetical protein
MIAFFTTLQLFHFDPLDVLHEIIFDIAGEVLYEMQQRFTSHAIHLFERLFELISIVFNDFVVHKFNFLIAEASHATKII